ncbi:MAG: hypothetical protein ACREMY_19625 [bacterium]
MAREPEPHPETDQTGETIEFAVIEQEQPERLSFEVSGGTGVSLNPYFDRPIEVRIGQTTETSPLFVHRGEDFPELCEAAGAEPLRAYVLVQPDVMAANPNAGWKVIREWTHIGRANAPQFRFGGDIARKGHISLGPTKEPDEKFEIVGISKNPTTVIVDRHEHSLRNYELQS